MLLEKQLTHISNVVCQRLRFGKVRENEMFHNVMY